MPLRSMGFGIAIQTHGIFPIRLLAIEGFLQSSLSVCFADCSDSQRIYIQSLANGFVCPICRLSPQSDLSKILARVNFRAGRARRY